jgi:hypothetical protein
MSSGHVVDAGAPAASTAAMSLAVHGATRLVAPVPGARRWWVESIHRGIELHAEVSAADAAAWARETRLAAGAGLFAVHLAVAAQGTRPLTAMLPHSQRPGLLAVVRQCVAAPPMPAERTLYAALLGATADEPAAVATLRPFLRRAAEAEGVWSHSAVDAGGRPALREVLTTPIDAGGELSPDDLLVLLASAHDLPACQLRAGRALERIMLTARAFGHHGVVLAGPGRLDRSRRALLAAGLDHGLVPQALLSISPAR